MNLVELICNTPFYPHWLDIRNEKRKYDEILKLLYGKVLETGAGNCTKKDRALYINQNITEYIATDYDSWDTHFLTQKRAIEKFGLITKALYGKARNAKELDAVCNALKLPYKNGEFDCYCSFEVLEHISDPATFFKEASRVLKKGGVCITVMPFLFREHGGIEYDFQRFSKGGFYHLAKTASFEVENISTYSCFGTTFASLTNQYLIRKFIEGKIITKSLLFPLLPIIFALTNLLGLIIDTFDHDERFAQRYFVVMKKT